MLPANSDRYGANVVRCRGLLRIGASPQAARLRFPRSPRRPSPISEIFTDVSVDAPAMPMS
jgi:hypothetical protein